MKNKIFIKSILFFILFISAYFSYLYMSKHYPKKWNIENWDLKQGWNPKIYRGERSYSQNSDNSIKDNFTGLIWQKKNKEEAVLWTEAKEYCETLSLDGYTWRLPTINELFYLVDIRKSNPCQEKDCAMSYNSAIDTEYFDIKTPKYLWSNTKEIPRYPSKDNLNNIRTISLATGSLLVSNIKSQRNGFELYVLCVSGK
jgi:hypothetical protein